MGERKVLNKYYPPDFNPANVPRAEKPGQIASRFMLPMSIRCKTCGDYISKGTKFNARQETAAEDYLGICIVRFYFKCKNCSAEVAVKTDPKNSDYVVEAGVTRNFEPWRKTDEEADTEEMVDAMRSLENRTVDSKREMDRRAALEEMMSLKSRHASVSVNDMLTALPVPVERKEERRDEEDEAIIKSIVFHNSKLFVRRIQGDDDEEDLSESVSGDGEMSINSLKRQKLIHDNNNSKPTDSMTKTSSGKQNGSEDSKMSKIIFKSPTVKLSVVKKPVAAKVNNAMKWADKKQVVDEPKSLAKPKEKEPESEIGSNVFQSLCQYSSDDE